MHRTIAISLFATIIALPGAAYSQDVKSILDTVRDKQLERWDGVTSYVVTQSIVGTSTQTYYQRTEVEDKAGNAHTVFLPVSAEQVSTKPNETRRMTPEAWEAYAQGAEMTGDGLSRETEDGLQKAGLPRNLLSATGGSKPWVSADPRTMMGGMATGARAFADAERQGGVDHAGDAQNTASQMAEFAEKAQLVGTELVDGRKAYHVQASDINHVQNVDGQEFVMQTANLWIDTEHHVPLRTRMEGVIRSADESRPFSIEQTRSDYRDVPNSNMYESYRQQMHISGMMDAAQQAQMQEAQKQIAEFERELARMPPDQRAMMESMMGSRLEMMRNMVSGGGYRSEVVIQEIRVNP